MLRPGTFALTALLAALTAVGPLSTDMYLPSLPDIARDLGASTPLVQFTLSAYLIGFACGQIVYGPISDRHGRKPVLLAAVGAVHVGDARLHGVDLDRDADRRARGAGARRLGRGRGDARHRPRSLFRRARRPRTVADRLGDGAGAGHRADRRRRAADGVRLALDLRRGGGRRRRRFRRGVDAAAGDLGEARRPSGPRRRRCCSPIASSPAIASISLISASARSAMPACSPGSPARRSCCRICTA